jgi:hypothetical protein
MFPDCAVHVDAIGAPPTDGSDGGRSTVEHAAKASSTEQLKAAF